MEFRQGVFEEGDYTASQLASDGAKVALQLSAIYLRDKGKKREYGGTICSFDCKDGSGKHFYVSMIVIGPISAPGIGVHGARLPKCPDHWTRAHTFHSHPYGSGPPSEFDRQGAKNCPGCVGLHRQSGTGNVIPYTHSGNGEPEEFSFDPLVPQSNFNDEYTYTVVPAYDMPQVECPCNCPDGCNWQTN